MVAGSEFQSPEVLGIKELANALVWILIFYSICQRRVAERLKTAKWALTKMKFDLECHSEILNGRAEVLFNIFLNFLKTVLTSYS